MNEVPMDKTVEKNDVDAQSGRRSFIKGAAAASLLGAVAAGSVNARVPEASAGPQRRQTPRCRRPGCVLKVSWMPGFQ